MAIKNRICEICGAAFTYETVGNRKYCDECKSKRFGKKGRLALDKQRACQMSGKWPTPRRKKKRRDPLHGIVRSDNVKEYKRAYRIRARKANRQFISLIKMALGCEICGMRKPECLDFHHINPEEKLATISAMSGAAVAKPLVLAEINKCRCLCANCHRTEHAKEYVDPFALASNVKILGML